MNEYNYESELQKDCNDYLRKNNILFIHLEKGRQHKSNTHRRGIPDLIIFSKGKTVFIELKIKAGTLSDEQRLFQIKAQQEQFPFYVVKELEDFKYIIKKEILKNKTVDY